MRMAERVLVIDDDPDFCASCVAVLGQDGYEVRVAQSSAEGLSALREQRPDLVVLDVMMEQADSGFRLAEAVAREYPGLPVLLLTAIADAAAQVFDLSQLPVSEIVSKPMRTDALRTTVRRLLDQAKPRVSSGE